MMQDGMTPLYITFTYGHLHVADTLLAKGAELANANNVSGCIRGGGASDRAYLIAYLQGQGHFRGFGRGRGALRGLGRG